MSSRSCFTSRGKRCSGDVETLYPEYRKKIKATYVPPEPCKTDCGAAPPR